MKACCLKFLFKAFLILVVAGFFSACKHDLNLKPGNYIPGGGNGTGNTGSGGSDTTGVKGAPSFYSPAAVAVDAAGNIYVADYGNNMIRKITVDGVVSTLAGNGTQGAVNATGKLATFNQPTGLVVDASGNVLVADAGNDVIRKITPDGVVTNYAGSDSTGTADGPVATATFFHPEGLAIDGSGNVFVADAGNSLIRKISGGVVSTIAGNNANASTTGIIGNPSGLTIDVAGNIYVANYINSNILKIDPTFAVTTYAGSSTGQTGFANGQDTLATFYFPNSVALDAAGNLYVADGVNNVIRKVTPDRLVSTFAGSGTAGATDGIGVNASFDRPSGIATDAAGNIYVADSNNNLIRKITPAGVVTTIAGSGQSGANNGQAIARKNTKTINVAAKKSLSVFFNRRVGGVLVKQR